jgi:hypothetical protein
MAATTENEVWLNRKDNHLEEAGRRRHFTDYSNPSWFDMVMVSFDLKMLTYLP